MSQTTAPVGSADHRDPAPGSVEAREPRDAAHAKHRNTQGRRATPLVAGAILCVIGLVSFSGAGWALWKDRVDRDGSGFVSFGIDELQTEQYAIVGDLRGDGPAWLYGETVLGDTRVRATSQTGKPLFIGIAPKADVSRYLRGAGYATVDSFEVRADTTHDGAAPAHPPEHLTIWAASTQGTHQQTLTWTPRADEWSVVLMNADASPNVDVRGDAGAELPLLPWIAGGLLLIGTAAAVTGTLVLRRPAEALH